MRFPSRFPLPGEHGTHPPPLLCIRTTFSNLCRLWTIAQEVLGVYTYSNSTPISERVPLAFVEAKYQKLLVWSGTLQRDMERTKGCKSDVMIFQ